MPGKDQPTRRGGRGLTLGLLAVLIALLVAYLGRCLPGFGVGGSPSSGPPTSEERAAEPAAAPPDTKADDAPIVIDVRGDACTRGTDPAIPCEALCEALVAQPKADRAVVVNAAQGTHASVERVRACLEQAGFSNVAVRTE